MKYQSIQHLRAAAAIAVVVLHSHVLFPVELVKVPLLSDFGWVGVRLFFVISGFIIAERISRYESLGDYLIRRLLRVLPLYFLITIIALIVAMIAHQHIFTVRKTDSGLPFDPIWSGYILKSLLVIPQDDWPLFAVGWSLEFELVFYAAFGLAYFATGFVAARIVILVLAVVGLAGLLHGSHIAHPFMLYFLAGCVARDAYHRFRRVSRVIAPLAFFPATALWLAFLYGWSDLGVNAFVVASAISFASLVLIFLGLEARLTSGRVGSLVVLLGDASFAIYLFHWLVFRIVGSLTMGVAADPATLEIARGLIVVATLAGSVLVHKYVEIPMNDATLKAARRLQARFTARFATAGS